MINHDYIAVICFNQEIGRISMDHTFTKSYFQYNENFLNQTNPLNLFPETGVIRKTNQVQVFSQFSGSTFRGLPPMFADSLPDDFGNTMFNQFLQTKNLSLGELSPLQLLSYVSNRGMGALEYLPAVDLSGKNEIAIDEIVSLLNHILTDKKDAAFAEMNHENLLNVFKIGSSAGGVRPKIIISEHKESGLIYTGDVFTSDAYRHYIVKLDLESEAAHLKPNYYPREKVEFAYYLTAKELGIEMMASKLIDDRHFATLRFDRVGGKKKHILTATGLTGWDYKNRAVSSYENLFDLALFLTIPRKEINQLFKRMVFNLVFANTDDHLKNHAFALDENTNTWHLTPAYDLTFAINPFLNYSRITRAMSINGKREEIAMNDLMQLANKHTILDAKTIIKDVLSGIEIWEKNCTALGLPDALTRKMKSHFQLL
jgi:serine/threonine-protein kinase HipA